MELQVVDIEDMTIQEINDRIKRLEDYKEFYLSEKERHFNKTQPKATDMTGDRVQGGARVDKNLQYVIVCEELDDKIDDIQNEIFNLTKYVENELKRIGEYDPLMKKIVELRETSKIGWLNISIATNYSESQCRRIYKKYKNARDI